MTPWNSHHRHRKTVSATESAEREAVAVGAICWPVTGERYLRLPPQVLVQVQVQVEVHLARRIRRFKAATALASSPTHGARELPHMA